jgi:UDP-N-acetylglucosamine--N-acetylmuramyl-(pentapeptide) pyrophosphoryl-undecaprenol N-acetylglucosamine transferase
MRLAIAGGGTGGHISPAIAVAEVIAETVPEARIDFICTPRPVDTRMYADFGEAVHVMAPPRIDKGPLGVLLLPVRSIREFYRSRALLRRLGTEVLFATGGYPSVFPVLAARSMGIPCAIHESNSIPGRANRLTSRFTDLVMTGFRRAGEHFSGKTVYTGNPVRPSLAMIPADRAREELELPADKPVVLFLGGSQGARALNDVALKVPDNVCLLLQCGGRDLERVKAGAPADRCMRIFDFVDDPALLYSAADVAVARSGAMTVAELTKFQVPAFYVPYPHAADDHQRFNAMEAAESGGARVVMQDELNAEQLWMQLTDLIADPAGMESMRESLRQMMPVNPAETIGELILDLWRSCRLG